MGHCPAVVHPSVTRVVERYLADADRLLPGAVVGFYVVGSVALGSYRPGRSDVDFVAVLGDGGGDADGGDHSDGGDDSDSDTGPARLRRLRALHAASGLRTAATAVRHGRSPLTGTCNGVFLRWVDLATPVSEIAPVASHTGIGFTVGAAGSDVSPVAWKTFAERGIAMRGPEPAALPLDPQPELLAPWNLGNLERYWQPWAEGVRRPAHRGFRRFVVRPRWSTAWGMLGAPRLHCTLATGEVVSKEQAGEYALDAFPSRWHPLLADALAYRRGEPSQLRLSPAERARRTADFVLEVVASAREMEAAQG